MIGNIKRYNGMSSGGGESFDPDAMFDENNTATEENFIQLLEHEVYDSKYIGYKVQLSNSVDYDGGLWVIADVDHDSANTGQSNCYDLISQDCFYEAVFRNSSGNSWIGSVPRAWLNNIFYPGFSTEFKNHILKPKYKSRDTWFTDDYVILPSKVEINGGTASYTDSDGVAYPIFTGSATGANTSRKKYKAGTTSYYVRWWTRSRYNKSKVTDYIWTVNSDGSIYDNNYANSSYIAPLMRVS